jgi:hypothetical protein
MNDFNTVAVSIALVLGATLLYVLWLARSEAARLRELRSLGDAPPEADRS